MRPDGLLLSESRREIDNRLAPIPVTAYQWSDAMTQPVTLPVGGPPMTRAFVGDEISPKGQCIVKVGRGRAICPV